MNGWGRGRSGNMSELIVINDNTARVAALQSGQVDMIDRVRKELDEIQVLPEADGLDINIYRDDSEDVRQKP